MYVSKIIGFFQTRSAHYDLYVIECWLFFFFYYQCCHCFIYIRCIARENLIRIYSKNILEDFKRTPLQLSLFALAILSILPEEI